MSDREDLASGRFACSDRERALFEAGIKMGTLYHQFVGTPVNAESVDGLERTISSALEVQPFVESARVTIDRSRIPAPGDTYSYASLSGDMIDGIVVVRVNDARVTAEMRYDPELRYPLMYVAKVERTAQRPIQLLGCLKYFRKTRWLQP